MTIGDMAFQAAQRDVIAELRADVTTLRDALELMREGVSLAITVLQQTGCVADAQEPAGRSEAAGETVGDLWAELLDKEDRTSPEEHPEMALISFDEFADFIERAHPTVKVSGDAAEILEALAPALELYKKLADSPLGISTAWERKASNGKPLLYGGRRGLLAYGTIATWDEFDLIVELVNAMPKIFAARPAESRP